MGLVRLLRDVAALPFTLARPVSRLAWDSARGVLEVLKGEDDADDSAVERARIDLRHRHRRFWATDGRAHVELREVGDDCAAAYVSGLSQYLPEHEGVERVLVQPGMGRVVVVHDAALITVEELVGLIEEVEGDLGLLDCGFGRHRPDHPADREPIVEGLVSIGADVAGMGMASLGRTLRLPAAPIEVDAAALLTVASYVPWARRYLERYADTPALGTTLAVARALAGGLSQSFGGPLADVVHRASGVAAASGRYRSWERLEADLVGWHWGDGGGGLVPPERPGQLPDGPIERMARPLAVASSGAAGLGLLARPNLDRAISFLVAGTPKAARWGREAFAAHLAMYLADRDILLLDPGALERLDRLDTLLVPGDLVLQPNGMRYDLAPLAPEMLAVAREAELDVWVATDDRASVDRLDVSGTVGEGAEAVEAVRRMQANRHGVAVIAAGPHPALAGADVGMTLRTPGRSLSWQASMIGGPDLVDGYLLVLAIATAKAASRQSAHVAVAGTGVAGLMAFGGVIPGNLGRVVGAVNLAALVAHANGARLAVALARQGLPEPPDLRPFHAMTGEEALTLLQSTREGLDAGAVQARMGRPPKQLPASLELGRAIGEELANPLTPFLAAGAGLSAAAGSISDALLVGGVVGLNASIGGFQRFRADRATAALLRQERSEVTVVRQGMPATVPSDAIVSGDVLALQAGDVVPADCRILESHALEVDESNLTGEPHPVPKSADPSGVDVPVPDRSSMLYGGTIVAAGSALAVVVATGRSTEAYRGLLLAGRGAGRSGVEARLESLTAMVTPASVLAGLGVLGAGVIRNQPLVDVLSSGVSLAVAAVPEGLPLLATAAQQAAARRLSKQGVIVRNARAIEALGRVDVVCADKTGTLTLGRIRVSAVSDARVAEPPESVTAARRRVLAVARAATPDSAGGERLPHPTDRAILYAVEEAQLHRRDELGGWAKSAEIPFEPRRGFHATLGSTGDGRLVLVKGAPEVVLPRCDFRIAADGRRIRASAERRRCWMASVDELAADGLRVLVVAQRRLDPDDRFDEAAVDHLTFVGLLGLKDPVRETSRSAIEALRAAGVDVIMITGDHPVTARGIAAELDLPHELSLTGEDMDRLTDGELGDRLQEVAICARVTPAHKVRIVRALKQRGRVVAMTGDGANDAPAIRLADVGIALGTRATNAARDASDLVVTDDRIETIVAAVVEGRALWASVRDATAILVGGNLGEIAFTLGGSLLTGRPPINTRQLLLVNLMTDVLPAMAIAVSRPPDTTPEQLLEEGPDVSLGAALNRSIAERAIVTTAGTIAGWLSARLTGRRRRAGTVALASLVGTELGQTLVTSWKSPLVVASSVGSMAALVGIVQTPGLSQMFGCTPLGPLGWSQALTSAGLATAGSKLAPFLLHPTGNGHRVTTASGEPRSAREVPVPIPA